MAVDFYNCQAPSTKYMGNGRWKQQVVERVNRLQDSQKSNKIKVLRMEYDPR